MIEPCRDGLPPVAIRIVLALDTPRRRHDEHRVDIDMEQPQIIGRRRAVAVFVQRRLEPERMRQGNCGGPMSGVLTGAAAPISSVMEAFPVFATQTLPELSITTAFGK